MKLLPLLSLLVFSSLSACAAEMLPEGDTSGDADGDMISDLDEGKAQLTDTDGDGTPDYLDDDSDNDTIPDYREAGDLALDTAPVDDDQDGVADFRDTDSDNNGRLDQVDGMDDIDGDGVAAFADTDDDGDSLPDVVEIGANAAVPTDTDGDGTPDFVDTDSDNDTVLDFYEGADDYDGDGLPNYRDIDGDGDCINDRAEARGLTPVDSDGDGHPDFLDRDSDNDGVPDVAEDDNCDGLTSPGESSTLVADTDGDGVTDLIETAAGTDPSLASSNPAANGDFVFEVPYQKPQLPIASDLDFSTKLQAVDLYVMLDRSGSMATEINSIKSNLSTVVKNVACAPLGTGAPPNCIPDLWAGAATIGYQGGGANAFQNWVDIQPNPNFSVVPTSEVSGSNSMEPLTFASYAAVTGEGGANFSMGSVPSRATCTGSPAANAGFMTFGYPCFRKGALPVVLLATDEPPFGGGDTFATPAWSTVVKPQFANTGAKLVGILGDGLSGSTAADLQQMARDTGAVDAMNGNAPLVFNGSGSSAASAIQTGIITLANGLPLDLDARTADDPSDTVNAPAAFIDHLETQMLGTPQCANGLTATDTNADTYADKFVGVRTGTPVCWKVVSKMNTTVPATDAPQMFRATVRVYGDNTTELDERDVFFLVPPKPFDVIL